MHRGHFVTTRKGNHSSFLTTVVAGRRPLPSEICIQSDPPPLKNADFDRFPLITSRRRKSSIMPNMKSTMGFPTSYRWSAYVIPKSPKGWLKKRFFVLKIKFNFNRYYIVSLCENFQRQSCSIIIPHASNGP